MRWQDLPTPSALVDAPKLRRNCEGMRARACELGVGLRPHTKTHKTAGIARLQCAGDPGPVTVSTFAEAEGLLAAGFRDITLAFPLAPWRAEQACRLAGRAERFSVLLDHPAQVAALSAEARRQGVRVGAWVEVDCGDHRGGWPADSEDLFRAVEAVERAEGLEPMGLLTHGGHSYEGGGREVAERVANEEAAALRSVAEDLRARGFEPRRLSLGSTPTARAATDWGGITEMRPGNYVFFDLHQVSLGCCSIDEVAFSVLATVVGVYPHRRELVIDAGALAFSKDAGPGGDSGYGRLLGPDGLVVEGAVLRSLSQEHGVVSVPDAAAYSIGARLRFLPNHSCLAAACHPHLWLIEGDEVIEQLPTLRGW